MSTTAADGLRLGLNKDSQDYEILSLYDCVLPKITLSKFSSALHFGLCAGSYLFNFNKKITAVFATTTALALAFLYHFTQLRNDMRPRVASILTTLREEKRREALSQLCKLREYVTDRVGDPNTSYELSLLFCKLFVANIQSTTLYHTQDRDVYAEIHLLEPQKKELYAYDNTSTLHIPKIVYLHLSRDGTLTFPNINCAPSIVKTNLLSIKSRFTLSQILKQDGVYKVISQKITPFLTSTPHIAPLSLYDLLNAL